MNYHLVDNLANVDEVETNKHIFNTLRERILSFKASALSLNQPLWREKIVISIGSIGQVRVY